jgi:hypothetical protein
VERLDRFQNQVSKKLGRVKAGITDGNTIYQYSLGLTTDEYRSIALTNPTTLQGWYDAAHRLFNIDSRLGNINQNTRSEWDMDVDVILVNALSREEREQHVRNNLCFICHKDGHVSKECPDRKPYKGGFKSGKYKGKERCLIPFRINDKIMTEWF